jgi:hypothetical protein
MLARNLVKNLAKEQRHFESAVRDGRRIGELDFDLFEDRTREYERFYPGWSDDQGWLYEVRDLGSGYGLDPWRKPGLPRLELWVEKQAQIDVVQRAARKWRIGCITPRGYNGDAAAYDAGKRARDAWMLHDQRTVILYLGDHDRSGLDMAVDNARRLHMYATPNWQPLREAAFKRTPPEALEAASPLRLDRIALTMEQIQSVSAPPQAAKVTDSRYEWYVRKFGTQSSWEVDCLEPEHMARIIDTAILRYMPIKHWRKVLKEEVAERQRLRAKADKLADNWREVEMLLGDL